MQIRLLGTIILFLSTLTLQAQDVERIIAKHLEAMGGLPRLMYTSNLTAIGSVVIRQGSNERELIFSNLTTKKGKQLFQLLSKREVWLLHRVLMG